MPADVAAQVQAELVRLAGRVQREREALAAWWAEGRHGLDPQRRKRWDEQYVAADQALQNRLRREEAAAVRHHHDRLGLALKEAAAALGSTYSTLRRQYLTDGAPQRPRGRPPQQRSTP